MRVEFTQDWDIFPHEIIRAGATGTLCEIDESGMWIKMDTLYHNLKEWDNKAQLGHDERKIVDYIKSL